MAASVQTMPVHGQTSIEPRIDRTAAEPIKNFGQFDIFSAYICHFFDLFSFSFSKFLDFIESKTHGSACQSHIVMRLN